MHQKYNYLSYKGILGVDFLIANSEVYFLEINSPFSILYTTNKFCIKRKRLTDYTGIVVKIFLENEQISKDIFCDLKVKHSSYIIDYEDNQYDYKSYLDQYQEFK